MHKHKTVRENRYQWERLKGMLRTGESLLELLLLMQLFFGVGYPALNLPGQNGTVVWAVLYGLLILLLFLWLDGLRFGYWKCPELFCSQLVALLAANGAVYLLACGLVAAWLPVGPVLRLIGLDLLLALLLCYGFTCLHRWLYPPRRLVLVYGSLAGAELKLKMQARAEHFRVCKLIREEEPLETICGQFSGYDGVVLGDVKEPRRSELLTFCYEQGIRVYTTARIPDLLLQHGKTVELLETPLFLIREFALTLPQQAAKRLFDLVVALLALVIAAPLMGILAVLIKLEDGGPVFFRQKRATYGGKIFDILKFRTMVQTAEGYRITKVGAVLRDIRLDELPQLLNILKGDMSIVGPRPERVEHMDRYTREVPEFPFRLKIRGGLTGYAQIYGKYNTSAYDKLCMDLQYIQNYSFLGDMKLILLTLRVLFQKESTEGFEKSRELKEKTCQLLEEKKEIQ